MEGKKIMKRLILIIILLIGGMFVIAVLFPNEWNASWDNYISIIKENWEGFLELIS